MSTKARVLAQPGQPPGWLEESDPAGVNLYLMDGRTACHFRTVPVALTGAAQLRAENFQLLLNSKCTQPSVMSCVTQGRHGLVL